MKLASSNRLCKCNHVTFEHLKQHLCAYMWDCHLWGPSAVWVEEADRLWGRYYRGYRGYCLVIHFKWVSRQTLERHYSSRLLWSACSCSSIRAQGRALPAEDHLVSTAQLVLSTSQSEECSLSGLAFTTWKIKLCSVPDILSSLSMCMYNHK